MWLPHNTGAALAIATFAQADDVADRVDAHVEPEIVHPRDDKIPTGFVSIR